MYDFPTPQVDASGEHHSMWIAVSFALALVISLIDYYSGPDLTFSLFYLAVIALYSWKTAVLPRAILAAIAISVLWLIADRFTVGAPAPWILFWNAVMRLIILVGLAWIICRLRETLASEQSLARSDFLTNTMNTRAFAERASLEISRARRSGRPLTVAFVDVDDFKLLNDRYGHAHGDVVLRSIAATLKKNLRDTDCISRVGGDEFVILLPETNVERARTILSKLHSNLSASMHENGPEFSLSIGAVVFDDPPAGVDTLMKASDVAMYRAKSKGKNLVFVEEFNATADDEFEPASSPGRTNRPRV